LISAPRFRLKGKGWYETDFKKDNQRNLAKSDTEPSKAEKKDSKSTKDDSKSSTKAKKSSDKKSGGKVDSA